MYSDYGSYGTPTTLGGEGAAAAALGGMIGGIIGGLVGYAIGCFILSRIFKKAGRKPYEAWIPILSTWRLFEMGDKPGWWAILMAVPFVNFVAAIMMIIAWVNILKNFGKPSWWVVLLIFFPIVPVIVLAFTDCTWQGDGAAPVSNAQSFNPPVNQAQPGFTSDTTNSFNQPSPVQPVTVGQPFSAEQPVPITPVAEPMAAPVSDMIAQPVTLPTMPTTDFSAAPAMAEPPVAEPTPVDFTTPSQEVVPEAPVETAPVSQVSSPEETTEPTEPTEPTV